MRKFVSIAAALLLAACTTAAAEPRAKSLADAAPEPSAEMPVPDARGDGILSLLAVLYPGWPEGGEGRQSIDIKIEKNLGGVYQATIIQVGLLDDSVAQTKDVLTFAHEEANDDAWRVTRFEQYRKCYRTGMFEWTTRLCP